MFNAALQPVKDKQIALWQARAIFNPSSTSPIDILGDRQWFENDKEGNLRNWLNMRGISLLNQIVKDRGIQRDSNEVVEINEFVFRLVASPNASYGYLYIDAVELPLVNKGVGTSGSNQHCTVYSVEDVTAMWSSYAPLPRVGQDVELSTSWGRQKGTVVGYQVEHDYLHALTRLASPPKGFVENVYTYEVGKVKQAIRSASVASTADYVPLHIEKAIRQQTDRRLRAMGLLPKTAGMKKIKETALFFAAGVDMVQPELVTA